VITVKHGKHKMKNGHMMPDSEMSKTMGKRAKKLSKYAKKVARKKARK